MSTALPTCGDTRHFKVVGLYAVSADKQSRQPAWRRHYPAVDFAQAQRRHFSTNPTSRPLALQSCIRAAWTFQSEVAIEYHAQVLSQPRDRFQS